MNTPKRGDLLISEPFLPDPNFERSVVLLCEHNEEGAFGFILNKPSLLKFDDVMREHDFSNFKETLYIGGPVQQDSLHFVHRCKEIEGGIEITEGLYWGGNFEQLVIMINQGKINPGDFKFFLGYSGWAEGQLMTETEENSWIVYSGTTPGQIFDTLPEVLWRDVLKNMGGKYKMFSNYPIDPRLN